MSCVSLLICSVFLGEFAMIWLNCSSWERSCSVLARALLELSLTVFVIASVSSTFILIRFAVAVEFEVSFLSITISTLIANRKVLRGFSRVDESRSALSIA